MSETEKEAGIADSAQGSEGTVGAHGTWHLDLVGNGLSWPHPSARRDVYVVSEGGLVAIVPPCSNPRRAMAAGPEVPDTDDCQQAMDLRDARARLIAAAPEMRERLRQTAERIERVRVSFNALVESMPGKYDYSHPLFALKRDVSALALQAELAAIEQAKAEGR